MADFEIKEAVQPPLCPHCDVELTTLMRSSKGFFERHVVYSCPNCRKLLAVGNALY